MKKIKLIISFVILVIYSSLNAKAAGSYTEEVLAALTARGAPLTCQMQREETHTVTLDVSRPTKVPGKIDSTGHQHPSYYVTTTEPEVTRVWHSWRCTRCGHTKRSYTLNDPSPSMDVTVERTTEGVRIRLGEGDCMPCKDGPLGGYDVWMNGSDTIGTQNYVRELLNEAKRKDENEGNNVTRIEIMARGPLKHDKSCCPSLDDIVEDPCKCPPWYEEFNKVCCDKPDVGCGVACCCFPCYMVGNLFAGLCIVAQFIVASCVCCGESISNQCKKLCKNSKADVLADTLITDPAKAYRSLV